MPYTIAVYMVRGFYADPEGGTTTTAEETVAFMTGLLVSRQQLFLPLDLFRQSLFFRNMP